EPVRGYDESADQPHRLRGNMPYYSETDMTAVRTALEAAVLTWPRVERRRMFGCPTYLVGGRLFAFLVTGGVVLTRLPEDLRELFRREHAAPPFRAGPRTYRGWLRAALSDPSRLDALLPYLQHSYAHARDGE